jgi:hypothetical protein
METTEPRIVAAKIVYPTSTRSFPLPPEVLVQVAGEEAKGWQRLLTFYDNEISFQVRELVGLTLAQAHHLKFTKDQAYLRR